MTEELRCKQCQEIITGQRRKFCDDDCSYQFYKDQKKYEKQRALKLKEIKFCKYELCGKQLELGSRKSYCKNTTCAGKQNSLEAKRKRDSVRNSKGQIVKICANKKCEKEFTPTPMQGRKIYCSDRCNHAMVRAKKKEREIVNINIKKRGSAKKKSSINQKYLVRGDISGGNRGSNICVSA